MEIYTLENGQVRCDGKPALFLTRCEYGEGAHSAAEIDAHAAEIVARINAFPAMLDALKNAMPWLVKADIDGAFNGCALPLGGKKAWQQMQRAIDAAMGAHAGDGEG